MLIKGHAQKYASRMTIRAYASVMRVPFTGPGTTLTGSATAGMMAFSSNQFWRRGAGFFSQ
jgi:hypothetical protein